MNKVVLVGRLTKDAELKYTQSDGKAVASFTLAVDRRFGSKDGNKEADFIPCVIWGKQAENTANFTGKGKLVSVSGAIRVRSYDKKDGGGKVYVTEVVCDEIKFLEWNGTGSQGQTQFNDNNFGEEITPVDDGGDIPF